MKSLLLSLLILACISVNAQTYKEKALQIQKLTWENQSPEFNNTVVPDKYKNESAVILAHSVVNERTSKSRVKFIIISGNIVRRTIKTSTLHERVKINDKAALEKFSTLEYQKKLDKSMNFILTKATDSHESFIGAKIIKPDGKVVMVNTSEEVLTKDTNREKVGKLAIPDLQVGDILDYYISNYEIVETAGTETFAQNDKVYMLTEDYPVLYYNLDFTFGKNISVKYILANGAPEFKTSTNADGDQIFNLRMVDVPKHSTSIWTSPYRQYPYLEISSAYNSVLVLGSSNKESKHTRFETNKKAFETAYRVEYAGTIANYKSRLKKHFDGNRALKAASRDSVLKTVYNLWKYYTFDYYRESDLENFKYLNYRTATSKYATIALSQFLNEMDIDHRILLVSSRNTNTLDNIYNYDDFDAMIVVDQPKPVYLCFNDAFCHFNEIPAQYQGEKAISIEVKSRKGDFKYGDYTLPVTDANTNTEEQLITVSMPADRMQKLKIERKVIQSGHIRHGKQYNLIPADVIDDTFMNLVKGEVLKERLTFTGYDKDIRKSLQEAFAQAGSNQKANFLAEIKEQYDQEPQDLADYKVLTTALEFTHPKFEYSSSFSLDNLVKQAGPNYLLDVGKLTGTFLKLDDNDRVRNVDVYMPSARTFKYTITVNIPAGYQIKGIDELNKEKKNKTGQFSTKAIIKGNTLTLTVNKVYNNNFEKATDWNLLTELIDAGSDFNNSKILLEKQI